MQKRTRWDGPWTLAQIQQVAAPSGDCWLWPEDRPATLKYTGKRWYVHALALYLHNGDHVTPERPHVAHSCGAARCVNPRHLRVDTVQGNMTDKDRHGTQMIGERHHASKLTDAQRREICASSEPVAALAARYGMSGDAIRKVRRRGRMTYAEILRERARLMRMRHEHAPQREHLLRRFQTAQARSERVPAVPNDPRVTLRTPCIVWSGAKTPSGYGRTCVRGKMMKMHTLSAIIHHNNFQRIPRGMLVRHLCRVKACFNPEHLSIGTAKQNAEDTLRAGSKACKLTLEDVSRIRASSATLSALAAEFGVSTTTVWSIRTRRAWNI